MITLKKLKTLYPKTPNSMLVELTNQLEEQDWPDKNKEMFLAQCAHESRDFTVLRENLNYSTEALLRVFPKYFNKASAKKCARNPEAIANRVYGKRLGNSESGDGWKYRGRGLIQITGKYNYAKFGHADDPEYLETPKGAVESAIWFWNFNALYNIDDFKLLTKLINGGYTNYDARLNELKRIQS